MLLLVVCLVRIEMWWRCWKRVFWSLANWSIKGRGERVGMLVVRALVINDGVVVCVEEGRVVARGGVGAEAEGLV